MLIMSCTFAIVLALAASRAIAENAPRSPGRDPAPVGRRPRHRVVPNTSGRVRGWLPDMPTPLTPVSAAE